MWGAAEALWDDGTADFAPRLAALPDGALLAVWANARAALPEGASLDEALAGLEIAAGRRDPATGLWFAQNLTSNAYLDHSPVLAVAPDGSAMAAWLRNQHPDPLGGPTETNHILFAQLQQGAWSEENPAAVNLGATPYLDLAYNGAQAVLVFAADLDGDLATLEDQELYGCVFNGSQWGAPLRLTDNAVQDTRPYVRYAGDGTPLVVWFQGGKVVSAQGLALENFAEVGEIGDASAAQDFRLVTGSAGQIAAVWQDAGTAGAVAPDPYILQYDPVQGRWSQAVRLLDDPELERGFSGVLGGDGRLRLAYTKVAVGADAEGVPTFGAADLCLLDHPLGPDPAISPYGITLATNDVAPGGSVDIRVLITNFGEADVTNLAVCVYAGDPVVDGALIGATQRVAVVVGGGSTEVSVSWEIPEATNNLVIYAAVDPAQETADRNRANNTATLAAILPDLVIGGTAVQHETADVRLLTVTVANAGATPAAAGARVSFRRGAPDGVLLAEDELGAILTGTNNTYDAGLRWDLDGIVFTSAFETVFVAVDPGGEIDEIDTRNNTAALQVMTSLDSDGDGLLDGEELRLGTRIDLADSDGDGLADFDEIRVHGTNPLAADSDGDGANDRDELLAATDPLSATDVFKITTLDGAEAVAMRVRWNAKAGMKYRVETAPDLTGTWTNAPSTEIQDGTSLRLAEADGVMVYVDVDTTQARRFYRVRTAPAEEEDVPDVPVPPEFAAGAYLKPTNTAADSRFGFSVAVNGDTAIVGAPFEDGTYADSGAAYIFIKVDGVWSQQAYLKASPPAAGNQFGYSVDISGDTAVVGAPMENGYASQSGAAYVFVRTDGTWSQQAYLKASNRAYDDRLGYSVGINGDSVIVGAPFQDGSGANAGAAYVFTRSAGVWSQQAYLKASNVGAGDCFGGTVDIDGDSAIVGAFYEDDLATDSGAAYMFTRSAGVWSQQAFLKAANAGASDYFGLGVAISGDSAIVGAPGEDGNATGVDGDPSNNGAADSGAAYIFARTDGVWSQQAYLKATNTGAGDSFGYAAVDICGDIAVVGAFGEDGGATGVNGADNNTASGAGAAYAYARIGGVWTPLATLKASNTGAGDRMGIGVATDGATILAGADEEDGGATVVDGANDNTRSIAGAAYTFDILE